MPSQKPKIWYFPTPEPEWVIACEYNASDDRYNKNCKKIKVANIPDRVAVELKRFSNAIVRYV